MKFIFEANQDEEREFSLRMNGVKWSLVAWDLDQWLRNQIKHGGKEEFQIVRDELHMMMDAAGLSLEDID